MRYAKEQEAAGIRAVGEAEASAIQAKGIAEAEAMEKKAEAVWPSTIRQPLQR